MRSDVSSAEWLTFAGYTALGYLALAIHRWVFSPDLGHFATNLQLALVMCNLVAGTCCFLRALRAALAVTGAWRSRD